MYVHKMRSLSVRFCTCINLKHGVAGLGFVAKELNVEKN